MISKQPEATRLFRLGGIIDARIIGAMGQERRFLCPRLLLRIELVFRFGLRSRLGGGRNGRACGLGFSRRISVSAGIAALVRRIT
jgi:hypothetical protein